MILTRANIAYLSRVQDALETDKTLELTMHCPECDETLERDEAWDTGHIVLTTWTSHKSENVRDIMAIGCEGYHILQQFADPLKD